MSSGSAELELFDDQVVQMTPIGPEHSGYVGARTGLLSPDFDEADRTLVDSSLRQSASGHGDC